MKKITILITGLFVISLSSIAFADDGFRWGKKLVSVGDTTIEVLLKCGEPSLREVVGYEKKGSYWERTYRKGTYNETCQKIEIWYYNSGKGGFIRILTFKGGVLKDVESGDYGSGKPDWERTKE